jgi:hypothetical protein
MGHVACMAKTQHEYKALIRKPKGKRPLGRIRCRWEVNIFLIQLMLEKINH